VRSAVGVSVVEDLDDFHAYLRTGMKEFTANSARTLHNEHCRRQELNLHGLLSPLGPEDKGAGVLLMLKAYFGCVANHSLDGSSDKNHAE
jgi:hypothetical protein